MQGINAETLTNDKQKNVIDNPKIVMDSVMVIVNISSIYHAV